MREQVGTFKAYAREFPAEARHGALEVRFTSPPGHEAMLQALEVLPEPAPPAR